MMKRVCQTVLKVAGKASQWTILCCLFVYRYAVSPVVHMLAPGGGCRYYPTCSEYAREAVRLHGARKGSLLAFKRLSRCHPWGSHGYDPVPLRSSCTRPPDCQHPPPFPHSRAENSKTAGHKTGI